jgi:P27 family predicted phage terminase small subunit
VEPECPSWLDDIAKAEWEHVVGVLREMNLLSVADQTALICYCNAWSRYRMAFEQVQKFGAVILSPNKKYPMPSPYQSIMERAEKDIMAWSDRFGLSPSARARLAVEPKANDDDKWKRIVG